MTQGPAAPLGAAVIGCGWMGTETSDRPYPLLAPGWLPLGHAQAIRATPGLSLTALCDSNRDRLDRAGDLLGVDARYTDHQELLRKERPQVVGIATRMPGRCRIIRDCVEAGVRGIHAEKPMAPSLAECAIAFGPMRKERVAFTFGTLRRFAASYRRARMLVQDGTIGELRHITIEHGRDLLMWGHPHSVDLILYFAGNLDVETAQASCIIPPDAVRGNVIDADPMLENAFFRFANGVTAAITTAGGFNTHLDGTKGRLSIEADGTRIVLQLHERNGSPYRAAAEAIPFDTGPSPTVQAFREIVSTFNTGVPTATPLDAVEAGQRLLMAIAFSAANGGRQVRPQVISPQFTVTSKLGGLTA